MTKNKIKEGLIIYSLCFSLNILLWKCSGYKTYTGDNNFGSSLTWHEMIGKIPIIAVISLILVLGYFYVDNQMKKK